MIRAAWEGETHEETKETSSGTTEGWPDNYLPGTWTEQQNTGMGYCGAGKLAINLRQHFGWLDP
jgi:hypothetical protein